MSNLNSKNNIAPKSISTSASNNKKPWEKMKISHLGDIETLVQGGGGKLTATGTDPGESRKTRGGGG